MTFKINPTKIVLLSAIFAYTSSTLNLFKLDIQPVGASHYLIPLFSYRDSQTTLPENIMVRKHHHSTAAEIIGKLPLHQQLDASRAMLVKLLPAWQSWAQRAVDEKRLSNNCYQHSHLSSLQQGKLVLVCNNAVNASQIKHQKHNLLKSLHNQGFPEIQQITVRVRPPVRQDLDPRHGTQQATIAATSFIKPPFVEPAFVEPAFVEPAFVEPDRGSHKAIENILKIVKSDQLADSLRKLSATLKSF
ncbi:MAG: DUF721 domain-containing protein [Gammaproteobacteria bacterium]|nr:DUF721 domain-containing protein [Gammaproteobacteria bacterium]